MVVVARERSEPSLQTTRQNIVVTLLPPASIEFGHPILLYLVRAHGAAVQPWFLPVMRPLFAGILAAVLVGALVLTIIGAIYGSKSSDVIVAPPSPSPTPSPPSPDAGLTTWTSGDNVAGYTSTHPDTYGCSTVLFLPNQGAANQTLIEACYAANLSAITEASGLLCGILAAATATSTYLTVTCPANCTFAADLATVIANPAAPCGIVDVDVAQIENSLLKLSGSQSPAPVQLDRIDQRALPLDGTFNWTFNGSGPIIFVLDSGVDSAHADLVDKVAARVDLTFAAATTGDCLGHGTAVASQAVGTESGVSKSGSVVDVRITNCLGVTSMGSFLAALTMISDGFATYDRKVVAVPMGPVTDATSIAAMDALMVDDNVFVVAAAGNNGLDQCPGSLPTTLFVGALDVLGNDTRATFSNIGTCVRLAAPGVLNSVALRATTATYANLSGTSYAAGLVAGAAAMAWSADLYAGLTATQIQQLLLLSATTDLPNTAQDLLYTGDFGTLTTATSATPTLASPTHSTATGPSVTPTLPTPTVASTHSATSATPTVATTTPSPFCFNYTSYTQGGWGEACRTTATASTPIGCLRDEGFASAFPSALVIGCPLSTSPTFRRLNFTTSYAVSLFLPVVGTPAVLSGAQGTTANPTPFTAGHGGALAGNLLAAKLNVGFDLNNTAFSQCSGELQALCYNMSDPTVGATCGLHTLQNVIKAADLILGACNAAPICASQFVDPDDAALCLLSPAQINACLQLANANYGNGNQATQGVLVPCT